MTQAARSKGIDKYARSILQDKAVRKERLREEKTITEKIARLRALRLAKAAADKEAAERTVTAKLVDRRPKAVAKTGAQPAASDSDVRTP